MTRAVTGPGGEIKAWVEVFSYPWVNHDTGQLKGVIEYSRDITDRKKAEEARRQSEELLKTFLNSSQDKIFLKDERRRYLFMNEAGLSFLGLTREEIVGKTDGDIFSPGHADEIGQKDLAVLKKGAVPLLYEQRHSDRVLETTKFRVNLENGRTGIGGIIRDVTEQRLAEEALRQPRELLRVTLRSIGEGVLTADIDGRVLMMNPVAEQLTGWPQAHATGHPIAEVLDLVDERTRAPIRELARGALEGLARDGGVLLRARSGSEIPVAYSAAPMRDQADRRIGMVVVLRDISGLRRLEADLIRVGKMESLGVLSGGIAHDFNNLLTAILGYVQLARMGAPGPGPINERTAQRKA